MTKPPVQPRRWEPPRAPKLEGTWQRNDTLADLEIIPVPGQGPEDVAVDREGRCITGLADGRICRLDADGRSEVVADTGGRPLGIEHRDDGLLIVCDAHRGLLQVDPADGDVRTLADAVAGEPLRFCNNAALHPDGSILFTDSSRRFGVEQYKADLIEHSRTGRLLRWQEGEQPEVLIDGLAFANGVALTHGGDAVLVAETGAYRIRRLWLAGPRAGETEVLIDNLPGFPDNLSTGASGTVWAAIASARNPVLDFLLPRRPLLRKALWALPDALLPAEKRVAFVIGLDADGKVRHNLQGPGDRFHYVTGVREHDGHLLLGSLVETAIARIPLAAPTPT